MEKKKRNRWTDEMLAEDAKRFKTRTEWAKQSMAAYSAAQKRGILDLCSSHMGDKPVRWTKAMLIADALRFQTRQDWQANSSGAYQLAHRRRISECFAHMPLQRKPWTDEMVLLDAKKYKTRADWERQSNSAYSAACKRGLLQPACQHMEDRTPTDNDAIYIWKAAGWQFDGMDVYKIGVTSARLDHLRIAQVAKASGADPQIVVLAMVKNAKAVERQLHALGMNPQYKGFNGCSEFRALDPAALSLALEVVEQALQECSSEQHAASRLLAI